MVSECVSSGGVLGKTAPRDVLAPASKNSLGGIQTIFAVSDEVMADLLAACNRPAFDGSPANGDDDDAANDEDVLAATYDNGIELIKDRVNQLDWEDMERLVAGMLRAMGYCARVMPKGPDGGRDVVASPDALGLESPRIIAEVKHRKGAMGAPAVRSFIGGLRAGDRGLYVSTGGFTKEARYEADRANIPVRLLDLDAFVRHFVDVYDKADDETRSILPLTSIWWPA
ncbi:MAG: restriction endonuclease [Coriobacteriaceae bacterium]|nr:restriction endonuclease [Coriobacteriaceae bacterium]